MTDRQNHRFAHQISVIIATYTWDVWMLPQSSNGFPAPCAHNLINGAAAPSPKTDQHDVGWV